MPPQRFPAGFAGDKSSGTTGPGAPEIFLPDKMGDKMRKLQWGTRLVPGRIGWVRIQKLLNAETIIVLLAIFGAQMAFAGCPGCCSSHGGIANFCAANGKVYCSDGTVSPTCYCSSCGVAPSLRTQTIAFGPPPHITVGATGIVSATATSGLQIAFRSTTSSVCAVSGNSVTGITFGVCTITADQAGNSSYIAAPQVTQNITVGQGSQTIGTISFSATTLTVGGTTTASATATSGLATSFSSTAPTICSVSGSTVSGIALGTCTIAANQAGNASYIAAPEVTKSIAVSAPSIPIFAAGPYDGIYQWSPGYFLSVHQNADHLIGSIYWVYTGNTEQVGSRVIPEVDTFDLMGGPIVGSTATVTGTRFYRACALSYGLTFNSDSSLSVRLNSVSNSPGVSVADVDCAARYTPVGSVRTIPRIY